LYLDQSLKRFINKDKASKLFHKIATKSEINKAMYTEHFCQSIARTSLFNSMHQKMHHFFYYPYLDQSFANFNLLVPSKLKLEKKIAKKAFHEEALKPSFNRPRQGLSLAYEWLGNDLLSWTEKILLKTPHPIDNFFNQSTIKFMLRTHAKEKYDFGAYLWSLVVLKKWLILKKVSIKD
jgi:asparagine synthetase B (glutamine-hydrolysing)